MSLPTPACTLSPVAVLPPFERAFTAVSPSGDCIVQANSAQVSVALCSSITSSSRYNQASSYSVHDDVITAVCVLPSLKRASEFVILGLSSGFVRVISSQTGQVLLQRRVSDEPVRAIHLHLSHGAHDVVVLSRGSLIVLEGTELLFQLRSTPNAPSVSSTIVEDTALNLKRWDISSVEDPSDFACTIIDDPKAFDQLVQMRPLSTEPITEYVVVGAQPMLTKLSSQGEKKAFSAAALATNVASKVGSAVFSMVSSFWGKPAEPEKKAKVDLVTQALPLTNDIALEDNRRKIISICLDPTAKYAALADGFGRVLLADLENMTFIRIWKGYRNVQCGWIVSKETAADHSPRSALFLIIFTAKRGILEVWPARFGSRVAAFDVGCKSSLVYIPGEFGSTSPQCLVIRENGAVENLILPFACALNEAQSSQQQDKQILASIRDILKSNRLDFTKLQELCGQLKTISAAREASSLIIHPLLSPDDVVSSLATISGAIKDSQLSPPEKLALSELKAMIGLRSKQVRLFSQLTLLNQENATTNVSNCKAIHCRVLESLQFYLAKSSHWNASVVGNLSLGEFIDKFEATIKVDSKGWVVNAINSVKTILSDQEKLKLAGFLFSSLEFHDDNSRFSQIFLEAQCNRKDLTALFVFWFTKAASADHLEALEKWHSIASRFTNSILSIEPDMIPDLWEDLYSVLTNSAPLQALAVFLSSVMDLIPETFQSKYMALLNKCTATVYMISFLDELNLGNSLSFVLEQPLKAQPSGRLLRAISTFLVASGIQPQDILQVVDQPDVGTQLKPSSVLRAALPRAAIQSPIFMSADNISMSCAIDLCLRWRTNVGDLTLLSSAIEFFSQISNPMLRAASAGVLWSEFMSPFLSEVAGLFEKVGKAPKERICLKALNLKPAGVRGFILTVIKFLKRVTVTCTESGTVRSEREAYWLDEKKPALSSVSTQSDRMLSGEAIQVDPLHPPLLSSHIQLCLIMDLIMAFELKSVKPMSLFPQPIRAAFFSRLSASVDEETTPHTSSSSSLANLEAATVALSSSRSTFFSRILPFAVFAEANNQAHRVPIAKVISLADQMQVDVERLRIQLVCNLYECGLIDQAEESAKLVEHSSDLAAHLYLVACDRVSRLFKRFENNVTVIAELPPGADAWIGTPTALILPSVDMDLNLTPDLCIQIIRKTQSLVVSGSTEYAHCSELLEVCLVFDRASTV